ncbi:hypothetical protein [Elizabethkingia anophelis]|uniref:hypothetical protein n=1 Tax=Elizabethkingia anophelis TaxID=1117645 RepID=UPI003207DFEA
MEKIKKKDYDPPKIEIMKVDMEGGFHSGSVFDPNHKVTSRWGILGKYIKRIKKK